MKNIQEILRRKEREFERLKKELEALRTVASLLEEEPSVGVQIVAPSASTEPTMQAKRVAAPPATNPRRPDFDTRHDANLIPQPAPAPPAGTPIITGVVERRLDLAAVVRDIVDICT